MSDDCWGGMLYQHLGRPYNSPFAGLAIQAPHYLRLLRALPDYMQRPLEFDGRYPIGLLGDVEIEFVHYPTEQEAAEKWRRRAERMDFENLFVKINAGRKACTPELLEEFHSLPYERTLALSPEPRPGCVEIPNWCDDAYELFVRSQSVFDAVGWVAGKSTEPTAVQRLAFAMAAKTQ